MHPAEAERKRVRAHPASHPSLETVGPGDPGVLLIATGDLRPNAFSLELYGDPQGETGGLLDSIRSEGILEPLVVSPHGDRLLILSGHRRWACARSLGLTNVPCIVRPVRDIRQMRTIVIESNRQRRKSFTQLMREADALAELLVEPAARRSRSNLRRGQITPEHRQSPESQDLGGRDPGEPLPLSEFHPRSQPTTAGRTDRAIASRLGLGSHETYRQARKVWKAARAEDARAAALVAQLDAGTKTIHAAYKDLGRRVKYAAGFCPTPYDVWPFRHDPAHGVPHPGRIPAGIVAHLLHYFTSPGDRVVDPMAGGGTCLDVAHAMGRTCLAYDLKSVRPEVQYNDVYNGYPAEAWGCDLVFLDPPYHTMPSETDPGDPTARLPLRDWLAFLERLIARSVETVRPGGIVALLLASQTERDIPPGCEYVDLPFLGYMTLIQAGLTPVRRISCPMDGRYLPQQVQEARRERRMLGQVRDLIVMRKPA